MTQKTGTPMSSVISTRTKKTKKFIKHVNNVKKKNAKVCVNCEHNEEGFCNKFKGWCNKVNHTCNGHQRSYNDVIQKQRCEANKRKKGAVKTKSKKKKINPELGQVVKPNFDTTKLTRKKDL